MPFQVPTIEEKRMKPSTSVNAVLCLGLICFMLVLMLVAPLGPSAVAVDVEPPDVSASAPVSSFDRMVFLPLTLNNASNDLTTEVDVSPEAGGSGSTVDGTLQVDVPPGAVEETVTLTIAPVDERPPDGASDFGRTYDVTARNGAGEVVSTFERPVTLALSYADLDLRYVDESTLTVYRQEADGSWTALSTTRDPDARVARATTSHFSCVALFADAVAGPDGGAWFPYSIVRDDDGTLYAIEDFALYRLAPGTSDATLHFDWGWGSGHPGAGVTLDGVDLVIDQDTDTLYFTDNGYRIYTVDSGLEETIFYDGYAYGLDFDQDNDLLYLADDDAVRVLDAASGAGVDSYPLPSRGERVQDVALDGGGGVYVIATRNVGTSLPHGQFWGTLYYRDPTYGTWWTIASGFAYPYRVDVDARDTVYVTNRLGDAVSVVSGGRREVVGFIETSLGNSAVMVDGEQLLLGSDAGGLRTLPAARRDTPSGDLTTSLTPADTLSGHGNVVTLETSLQSTVPAHNFLQVNDRTVLVPVSVEGGKITYRLPKPHWYGDPYWDGGDTYRFCVGDRCDVGTAAPMPELGNWAFVPTLMVDQTLTVAQNEWLVWRGGFEIDQLVSEDGLFPDWHAPSDAATGWLAYRFAQLGTYTFTVTDRDGTSYQQTVTVTRMGRPEGRNQGFTVDPREGATIYNQGAILEIPPGALPGVDSYDVTFANAGESEEPPFQGTYSARSRGYYAIYDPEPGRLDAAITMKIPYDPDAVSTPPQAAVYAPTLDDLLNLTSSTDGDYVALTYPAGDYAAGDGPDPLSASAVEIAETSEGGLGYRVKGALNAVSDGIYWATGLPNAMVGDANFAVIYHTDDGVSDTYAGTLYSALDQARTSYRNLGYAMPDKQIVVKIAPWATRLTGAEGFVPQQSLFGYYYMFVNDQLTTADLQTTAAHELFHIAQSETASWSGWLPKWWTEGTAVWAEYNEYPSSPSPVERIEYGGDFVQVPYREWGEELTTEQAYGAAAFAIYLDEVHDNAAFGVFTQVDAFTDVYDALAAVVGDEAAFYADFAEAYWKQTYATASTWPLYKFVEEDHFTTYEHRVAYNTGGSLSSFMSNWFYDGTTTPPDSYTGASGSALRVANPCVGRSLYILDGDKQTTLASVIDDQVSPNGGFALDPLGTYDRQNQLYFLVINREVADPACALEVWLETPTIESISPTSVPAGQTTQVTITGGGFGPVKGFVSNAGVVPGGWSENQITVEVTPESVGEIELVVHHDIGDVGSSPATLTVE
jgi:hypothetical protein